MIVLLLGAPGVGKGTQAEKISEQMGFEHISTGDLLRSAVKDGTELGIKANRFMENGELVPDDLVVAMVARKLADGSGDYLLDGFPRNVSQAVSLLEILKDGGASLDIAIDIEVPSDDLVKRLVSRRVCSSCGRVYNLISKRPQKEGICDVCGGQLYQRNDDTETTVRNRLSVYMKETHPLIDYFEKMGIMRVVDGNASIEDVKNKIAGIIEESKGSV